MFIRTLQSNNKQEALVTCSNLPNGGSVDPYTIAVVTDSALNLLNNIKSFFNDSKIKEAQEEFGKKAESLESQVQQHHSILEDLLAQSLSNKHVIEEHNQVLLNLSEVIKKLDYENNRLRKYIFSAIVISLLTGLLAAYVAVFR